MKPLRLLLLGTLPPPPGGTTLLFEQLVRKLAADPAVRAHVVDTGARGLFARAAVLARFAAALPRCDVIALHASPPGIARAGPWLLRCGKPLVVRVFGGSLDADLTSGGGPQRERLECVLAGAARVLVETDLVAQWLATSRPRVRVAIQRNSRELASGAPAPPITAKHFVFAGSVSEVKGVGELLTAMQELAREGVTLDVIGACEDARLRERLARTAGVRYSGEQPNARVVEALANARALVLPTRHAAEGHPGAILEAFAAGRPAIATRFRAIPELVAHGENGLLVPPGDARALAAAMRTLASDDALAARLGAAAHETARAYDAAVWAERFVAVCREVARA
ncbi:MAG: glycosyltransferase family 4 protein [Deltaproteobacteria bacterium]|nr:glycosyltransferase family 4 protein [Deltaproteobacteria bacterium]